MNFLLPDIIFYEPTPKQLDKLVELIKRENASLVYDVGCGRGFLTKSLLKRRIATIGIDSAYREKPLTKEIIYADATYYQYKPDSCLIFARPCHSDWIRRTISQAQECEARSVFYISKTHNLEYDLGKWGSSAELLCTKIGREDEHLWKIRMR